jgi:glucose/arabinose dehydrogenase
METLPDGRVLVCEQTGPLRVIKDEALLPTPLIRLDVDDSWERGLLGVTVDPHFISNGYIYVCYVAGRPFPHHRISRLTVAGDTVIPASENIIFKGDDQRQLGGTVPAGHQGGALHFGNDGTLYLSLGEQTAGSPAQDLKTLQGKIVRIRADGSIPSDNPFFHKAQGKYRSIWAIGLRNPFTFAVQRETGRILINDVGGQAEEINEGTAGANYGWPEVEHGPTSDSRFRGPIHSYPTASIAGGAFCPMDSPWPAQYHGKYFFMDFVQGWIKLLDPERPTEAITFAEGIRRGVDLRFAADGSLYVLLRDAWVIDDQFQPHTGSLIRIRHVSSSSPITQSLDER